MLTDSRLLRWNWSCCTHQLWLQQRWENVSPPVGSGEKGLLTRFHVLLNFSIWNFCHVEHPSNCGTRRLEQEVTPWSFSKNSRSGQQWKIWKWSCQEPFSSLITHIPDSIKQDNGFSCDKDPLANEPWKAWTHTCRDMKMGQMDPERERVR